MMANARMVWEHNMDTRSRTDEDNSRDQISDLFEQLSDVSEDDFNMDDMAVVEEVGEDDLEVRASSRIENNTQRQTTRNDHSKERHRESNTVQRGRALKRKECHSRQPDSLKRRKTSNGGHRTSRTSSKKRREKRYRRVKMGKWIERPDYDTGGFFHRYETSYRNTTAYCENAERPIHNENNTQWQTTRKDHSKERHRESNTVQRGRALKRKECHSRQPDYLKRRKTSNGRHRTSRTTSKRRREKRDRRDTMGKLKPGPVFDTGGFSLSCETPSRNTTTYHENADRPNQHKVHGMKFAQNDESPARLIIRKLMETRGMVMSFKEIEEFLHADVQVSVPFAELTKYITETFQQNFKIIPQDEQNLVTVQANMRICEQYTNEKRECSGCKDLHICRFYLLGSCNIQCCKFSHNLSSDHNKTVLNKFLLDGLTDTQVINVARQIHNRNCSTIPVICKFYNNKPGCKSGDECTYLHVCKYFLQGDCKFQSCKRSHYITLHQPKRILKKYSLSVDIYDTKCLIELLKNGLKDRERDDLGCTSKWQACTRQTPDFASDQFPKSNTDRYFSTNTQEGSWYLSNEPQLEREIEEGELPPEGLSPLCDSSPVMNLYENFNQTATRGPGTNTAEKILLSQREHYDKECSTDKSSPERHYLCDENSPKEPFNTIVAMDSDRRTGLHGSEPPHTDSTKSSSDKMDLQQLKGIQEYDNNCSPSVDSEDETKCLLDGQTEASAESTCIVPNDAKLVTLLNKEYLENKDQGIDIWPKGGNVDVQKSSGTIVITSSAEFSNSLTQKQVQSDCEVLRSQNDETGKQIDLHSKGKDNKEATDEAHAISSAKPTIPDVLTLGHTLPPWTTIPLQTKPKSDNPRDRQTCLKNDIVDKVQALDKKVDLRSVISSQRKYDNRAKQAVGSKEISVPALAREEYPVPSEQQDVVIKEGTQKSTRIVDSCYLSDESQLEREISTFISQIKETVTPSEREVTMYESEEGELPPEGSSPLCDSSPVMNLYENFNQTATRGPGTNTAEKILLSQREHYDKECSTDKSSPERHYLCDENSPKEPFNTIVAMDSDRRTGLHGSEPPHTDSTKSSSNKMDLQHLKGIQEYDNNCSPSVDFEDETKCLLDGQTEASAESTCIVPNDAKLVTLLDKEYLENKDQGIDIWPKGGNVDVQKSSGSGVITSSAEFSNSLTQKQLQSDCEVLRSQNDETGKQIDLHSKGKDNKEVTDEAHAISSAKPTIPGVLTLGHTLPPRTAIPLQTKPKSDNPRDRQTCLKNDIVDKVQALDKNVDLRSVISSQRKDDNRDKQAVGSKEISVPALAREEYPVPSEQQDGVINEGTQKPTQIVDSQDGAGDIDFSRASKSCQLPGTSDSNDISVTAGGNRTEDKSSDCPTTVLPIASLGNHTDQHFSIQRVNGVWEFTDASGTRKTIPTKLAESLEIFFQDEFRLKEDA